MKLVFGARVRSINFSVTFVLMREQSAASDGRRQQNGNARDWIDTQLSRLVSFEQRQNSMDPDLLFGGDQF